MGLGLLTSPQQEQKEERPDGDSSFVSQHAHDAGADGLGRHVGDELRVALLHVNDQHHAD